jgi:hypothetical protein
VPTGNVEILVEAQCAFTAGQCGTLHRVPSVRSLLAPRVPPARCDRLKGSLLFVALPALRRCALSRGSLTAVADSLFLSLSRVDFFRCAATQDLIEQTTVLLETMPENMVLCMVRACQLLWPPARIPPFLSARASSSNSPPHFFSCAGVLCCL